MIVESPFDSVIIRRGCEEESNASTKIFQRSVWKQHYFEGNRIASIAMFETLLFLFIVPKIPKNPIASTIQIHEDKPIFGFSSVEQHFPLLFRAKFLEIQPSTSTNFMRAMKLTRCHGSDTMTMSYKSWVLIRKVWGCHQNLNQNYMLKHDKTAASSLKAITNEKKNIRIYLKS